MYQKVKSSQQQKQFEHTWEYFCEMYGWYNDPYAKNGIRYNLLLPDKPNIVIGTIEFIPYDPKNPDSTVEGRCRFFEFEEIKAHQKRVWEIDKLCLHKDYHRQGYFENFMDVFYDHASRNNPKYYIGLMEKRFFRMLRISFGLGVEQKGEALVGPTTALIPVVFDVEKLMRDERTVRVLFENKLSPYKYQTHPHTKLLLLKLRRLNSIYRMLFSR
ncbi:hypothetical protein [Bacillus sp. FSL K6-3431]|uniref:hypothetical protein n=1 Tax=Bacillus sp. FSL K6-3431 TaxID=2921500 RepID=UPI0030F592A7